MNQPQNKPFEIPCQPFFENELNFNPEDRLLSDCGIYCLNISQQKDSPWQRHANLMGYWHGKGQTKISKLQRNLLHYLHQWYFSKGNPAYLKTKNLAKHLKTSRQHASRAVTRLVNRKILIRLEYWSDKYQRFRSVILPQLHKTLKEKLVFILQKRVHPVKETGSGGRTRYFRNTLNSLRIQKCNIYINILYTNYLYSNTPAYMNLTTLNYASLAQGPAKQDSPDLNFVPINPLLSNARGIENMQTELKPKRITLKVQNENTCPSSINESIKILIEKDFNPKSIPHVALSDLLYHVENQIFSNHGDNNPNLKPPDINSFFRIRMFDQSKFVEQYDTKLFKMLMRLFVDDKNFHDKNLIPVAKRIIGYWSTCARNNKGNNTKFTNHNSNLTTKVGFKMYIGFLYHMHYTFNYDKSFDPEFYGEHFKRAINRFFNYAYVLNLPKKVAFDTALIDHTDSDRFIKCLTLSDDDFYAFVNSSKRNYQARPESKKSLNNFREIFVGTFYEKDKETGRERFEQYRPKFSRFLEILIARIEKYSDNGKRVELSGLKLTAETSVDMPVLYYYMEWLRNSIFSETVFKFDQMFSLENWNSFIKSFMRNERGYSNYWKIVDRN